MCSVRSREALPGPRVFVLDNHDSFTWNLVDLLRRRGADVRVRRPDEVSACDPLPDDCDRLLISPGPSTPTRALVALQLLRLAAGRIPVLGVCLGHQCLAEVFGGSTRRAPEPVHGRAVSISHDGRQLFRGIPSPFSVARYHSLAVHLEDGAGDLEVTARTEDGIIMGLRHRRWPIEGVQFHPESFLTEHGTTLIDNFLAEP